MKNLFLVVVMVSFASLCESASAQSNFFVFGSFGNTGSNVDLGSQNRVDDDGASYSLGAGYQLSSNFSVEAAFLDVGDHYAESDCPPGLFCLVTPVQTRAKVSGVSLSLTGSTPLTDQLDLYGRLGIMRWDVSYEGDSSAFDASSRDLLYGAGLRWRVSDRWGIFADYGRVELDLDTASLGVRYQF